ncbi:MAG TPA: hypothetical protein VLD65_08465 [Anaerolineales bacterium]|nr:hypothetical protein [Anaerolineales bacterium]
MVEKSRGEQFLKDFTSKVVRKNVVCPARISSGLVDQINQTVLQAFKVLECRDWCRIDLRLGNDGKLYVLELNPIARIAPGYWLPNSAIAAGLDYTTLINRILDIAWERIHANPCI